MNQTFPIISKKPTFNFLKRCNPDMITTSPKAKRIKNHDFNLNTSLIAELTVEGEKIARMVSENAVIVFGRHGCCMCHVVKQLLQGLGVNPVVYEIEDSDLKDFDRKFNGIANKFPAVFIGGELYGGLDRVIATHISGELVPLLKQAGALWL